jgi:hypothetical protein
MGRAWVDDFDNPSAALLQEDSFIFIAGKVNSDKMKEMIVRMLELTGLKIAYVIPENKSLGDEIESIYRENCKKIFRYSIKRKKEEFDLEKLQSIVDNIPENAITFTKDQTKDPKEMLKIAEKLSNLIDIDTTKVRDRDKKDFWILKNPDKVKELITKKEWGLYNQKKLDDKQIYKLQLKRISQEDLNSFSPEDLKVLAIYKQFNSGYALTPQIVKNKNVTQR